VRRKGFLGAGGVALVFAAAALLLGSGLTGSTFALFNGETQNAGSTFAGGWVDAPSGASASVSGDDVAFTWTPGTHGPVTGQQLFGVDNATSSNCTGAAYALLATLASATTASYTDANRANSTNDGDWFCYELVSTSATVWTAPTPLSALQIGLAATGLSIANGGTAGRIDKNDEITITFNQKPTSPGSSIRVCAFTTGSVVIGDTTGSCHAGTDANSVGVLALTGATIASNTSYGASSVVVASAAPWTMTITLSAGSSILTGTPSWKLTPSASIKSAATTDQATACTAARTTCQPTTSTSF
jgi:hypothetical protein